MRIYLAAAYGRRLEMRNVAVTLNSWGHVVTSRWIGDPDVMGDGLGHEQLAFDPDRGRDFGLRDVADIAGSDLVISFTDALPARGGRHVEFGIAYAWEKRLIVCGPREHVFHCLRPVEWHPDWPTLSRAMGTWCVDHRTAGALGFPAERECKDGV